MLIRLDYRLAKAFKSSFPLFSKLVARSNLGRFLKSNPTDFLKLGLETPSKLLTEILGCTDNRPINALTLMPDSWISFDCLGPKVEDDFYIFQ